MFEANLLNKVQMKISFVFVGFRRSLNPWNNPRPSVALTLKSRQKKDGLKSNNGLGLFSIRVNQHISASEAA